MFGYVKPLPGELLLKEYELYKAIYCGLCRTGGKKVSRLTRLLLSYDFTALAALRLGLTDEEPHTEKHRCPYNLKNKQMLCCDGVFTYTAAAFACLSYAKAVDDVNDEKGLSRLKRLLVKPFAKRMKKKATRLYPDLYDKLVVPLKALYVLEHDGTRHTADEYAHHGADAIAITASYGLEGADAAIAYEAGYHIGRYIYLLDAVDDLKDDAKKGRFNPLAVHYGEAEEAIKHTEEVYETLRASSVRFSAAVGLAKASVYTDILQNIARFGMMSTAKSVYDKYGYKRKENEDL